MEITQQAIQILSFLNLLKSTQKILRNWFYMNISFQKSTVNILAQIET